MFCLKLVEVCIYLTKFIFPANEEKKMSLETWFAYLITAELILIIPGPTIILLISQAVAHGGKSVVPL